MIQILILNLTSYLNKPPGLFICFLEDKSCFIIMLPNNRSRINSWNYRA